LPKHDANIVLVDEDGDEFSTKYLIGKSGLSGGWRGFSIAHNLVENDVLVFQLIETCKFKVTHFKFLNPSNFVKSRITFALFILNLISINEFPHDQERKYLKHRYF